MFVLKLSGIQNVGTVSDNSSRREGANIGRRKGYKEKGIPLSLNRPRIDYFIRNGLSKKC